MVSYRKYIMPPFGTGGLMQLIAFGANDIYLFPHDNHKNGNKPHRKKRKEKTIEKVLKDIKFKNYRDKDRFDQHRCTICLERFKAEEFVTVRICRHIFHKECHPSSMKECPICRQ